MLSWLTNLVLISAAATVNLALCNKRTQSCGGTPITRSPLAQMLVGLMMADFQIMKEEKLNRLKKI